MARLSKRDAMSSDDSGSSDSDDAPEQVSLKTAKTTATAERQLVQDKQRRQVGVDAQLRKDKNRARDERLKLQATAAKRRKEHSQHQKQQQEDEQAEVDGQHDEAADAEDAVRHEPEAPVASTSGTKINYLDDSLFESAAKFYKPADQPAAGQGKMAMKRQARDARRQRGQAHRERAQHVNEGGSRTVDGVTLQHLPSAAHKAQSLVTTALPSHTSANKFITNRLYSKKRQLAVLDAGKPRPSSERKRSKTKSGGGMSEESKKLLGLGMDDGAREKEAAEEQARNKKRSLLLQAQGKRRNAALARPLASSRIRGAPAADFAVSSRTR
ncbi:hypothetical protein OIV83_002432 [Microbotryomycetes sp. JL201]|nr:hypothetical protein OIV83_002432 [Microbotryomycetes sp. JL201]